MQYARDLAGRVIVKLISNHVEMKESFVDAVHPYTENKSQK